MKIIKRIIKNLLIILISVFCLFGLKMIIPSNNENTNSGNNINENNLIYTNKVYKIQF